MDAGRTDTAVSTCLHVPAIGLLVGGDAVYNGIHPYLGETDTQSRLEWIATLDRLEALEARTVIAAHKVPGAEDHPRVIGETRQYLRDFNRLEASASTARELYDAMLGLHPGRANPGSLWGAAEAGQAAGLSWRRGSIMQSKLLAAAVVLAVASVAGPATAAGHRDPLDARTLAAVGARFGQLMEAANRHDLTALSGMYWRSPSTLLVAKSAVPSEGNWAGYWGNETIDRKLHGYRHVRARGAGA